MMCHQREPAHCSGYAVGNRCLRSSDHHSVLSGNRIFCNGLFQAEPYEQGSRPEIVLPVGLRCEEQDVINPGDTRYRTCHLYDPIMN